MLNFACLFEGPQTGMASKMANIYPRAHRLISIEPFTSREQFQYTSSTFRRDTRFCAGETDPGQRGCPKTTVGVRVLFRFYAVSRHITRYYKLALDQGNSGSADAVPHLDTPQACSWVECVGSSFEQGKLGVILETLYPSMLILFNSSWRLPSSETSPSHACQN